MAAANASRADAEAAENLLSHTCSNSTAAVDSNRAPGRHRRSRCPRTQPERHHRRAAAGQARRYYRALRQRQVQPRLRHHLCRGPAALRREPVRVRPPVPRPDGEAGRRPDRRPVTGHLDRPEGRQPEPALNRRDRDRGVRPPAPAVRADRSPALPDMRPRDRPHDRAADRGPDPLDVRGDAAARARPADQGPQDRGRPRLRGGPEAGLRPRPRRRGVARPGRGADARQVQAAHHRGRRRPAGRPPRRRRGPRVRAGQPQSGRVSPGRLGGDIAAARRRAHGGGTGRSRGVRRAALQRALQLPVRRHDHRRAGATLVLLQLAARCLPDVHGARRSAGVRSGSAHPEQVALDRGGRHRAVVALSDAGLVVHAGRGGRRAMPEGSAPRFPSATSRRSTSTTC